MGDLCNVLMCKRILASQTNTEEGVPFYKIGTIGNAPDAYISKELFDDYKTKYNYPHKGEVMITCAGTVGKCVIYDGKDAYYQDSNIVWIDNPSQCISNSFLYHLLAKVDWRKLNSTTIIRIYNDDLRNLKLSYPQIEEQQKISRLLSFLDERIATQNKIIDKLQSLIKGIRNDVFGKLRKDIGLNAKVGDVLSYEQPQPYIVEDTEYTAGGTPVLTANKAFVLGYTSETDGIYDKGDCIIFDDFTLDCKYVDFPFKVKSSAIKILTAKNKELLRYTFEFLKYLDLSTDEHKRHYIAETQNQEFILPTTQIVRTIAHAFSTLSSRMQTIVKQRDMLELQKQYLLRQMFI
ncbi:hypothetical protein DW060_01695 [Leyella stercorea]|uniref:Type I restriction modification DNA specificity domain-containing protein n=1 Tax=Leyella stercorea TaxID=363265 RepID=A0A3R6IWC5_9BACT|nr:hypothetical protein DW060_01695 [Leyella stercorea]